MPILTDELIEAGMSCRGGWNREQLELIVPKNEFTGNGPISLQKGWKKRLVGFEISQEKYERFLALKDRHLAHKSRKMPGQRELWQETYPHLQSIKAEIKSA